MNTVLYILIHLCISLIAYAVLNKTDIYDEAPEVIVGLIALCPFINLCVVGIGIGYAFIIFFVKTADKILKDWL